MALNRGLLIKVLGMTASDKDGEALNAIRKANELLKEAGETWDGVLAVVPPKRTFTVTVNRDTGLGDAAAYLRDRKVLDLMFKEIFAKPRVEGEAFWEKMDRLYQSYQHYGAVAPGDYKILRTIYSKLTRQG